MTELLEKAFQTARTLSPAMQDEIARIMLAYTSNDEAVIELTAEEEADLTDAQDELARGDFATDEEVEKVLSQYRV